MAKVTTYIDDMSGETLDDVEPTTITVDGTDYTLDLGEASKAHLIEWLSGEGAYALSTKAAKAPASAPKAAGTRTRLTGDAKKKFDKATEEYKAAKQEQRVKMYEYAATTDAHKDAVDSGKNIPGDLVEDFYAANPDVARYYGKAKTVEAPVNTEYAS